MTTSPLLAVEDLRTWFSAGNHPIRALEGVSFTINRGETFVLLGESGCGKSITALTIMRLLPHAARVVSGSVRLNGEDLLRLPEKAMRAVRGARIAMIFQEPQTSLNPVLSVGTQIGEALTQHQRLTGRARRARVVKLLHAVRIPEPERRLEEYPHQFSGGMKQRVMIAMALAGDPDLLIADEPTTALDVTIQAQVLELLHELQRTSGMAILFITHDLGVAYQMADRIAVMYRGSIVELAARETFFESPQHAYSQWLFDALPNKAKRIREAGSPTAKEESKLLEVNDLKVHFPIRKGVLRRVVGQVQAVDGVSMEIARGQTLAMVGESGSGKTSVGKGILQLIRPTSGTVRFQGEELTTLSARQLRKRRSQIQIVFQDPYSSMNPRMMAGDIIEEGMVAQRIGKNREERRHKVRELLQQVGLEPAYARRYPHEFSGGQRQRICIARALAVGPQLIVCDEPTSALDVSVQSQILELLRDLQRRLGLAYLFITHNLGIVEYIAHKVAVMYQGRIVEQGEVDEVLSRPQHPYTQRLLAAVPKIG
ncbi:MAG: ABC transporter ATP-binding protein [Nitrospiraceae bacterium]